MFHKGSESLPVLNKTIFKMSHRISKPALHGEAHGGQKMFGQMPLLIF